MIKLFFSCANTSISALLQLKCLVIEKWVDGWDDPRLMTLAGLRRRGVTSTSINAFVRGTGITRRLYRADLNHPCINTMTTLVKYGCVLTLLQ